MNIFTGIFNGIVKGMESVMEPDRVFITVCGHKIEEFYWGGSYVCYVDNVKSDKSFNELTEGL